MSSQRSVGYTETVVLEGQTGEAEVEAKCDTGAKRTSIDLELASDIGAGPIVDTKTFRSGVDGSRDLRPIVEVDVIVLGERRSVEASIADRDHLNYDVLLGRDVLKGFTVDLSDME